MTKSTESPQLSDDILLQRIADSYQADNEATQQGTTQVLKYHVLYLCLKKLIIQNSIPEGMNLPPSRVLAKELGLSRSTIIKALELVMMEGLIASTQGSGSFVKPRNKLRIIKKEQIEQAGFPHLSELGESFSSSVNLINSTEDKSIAFRPGIPPLDLFPVTHWKNLSNLYWRNIKTSELIYSPASGLPSVKKSIANYLNLTRNIRCNPDNIFIVAGSLQSLYLVGSVLVNPGDSVVMENPSFPNVRAIFKGLRANVLGSPLDLEGMEIPEGDYPKPGLKLIHCTPSCQYPVGTMMSLARRKELLEHARANNALIIENDYEHEINTYQGSLPSLFELDGGERTIYLGTFNRLLHPSIRIGYMVVPDYLMHAMESLLKHSHRFVPPSLQVVLSQFIDKKYLFKHIKKVNQVAVERRLIFEKAFDEFFPNNIRRLDFPTPSLHICAEIPEHLNDQALVKTLNAHNLICHPMSKCYDLNPKQGLIFGYASVRSPVIRNRLRAIAKIAKEGVLG